MAIGLGNIWRFPYMMGAFGGGWVTRYAIVYLIGQGAGDAPGPDFASFTGSAGAQAVFVYPCIALSVVVLRFGLRGGIERFGKLATPLFLLFFLVLASRSLALEGGVQKMIDYFIAGSDFRLPGWLY